MENEQTSKPATGQKPPTPTEDLPTMELRLTVAERTHLLRGLDAMMNEVLVKNKHLTHEHIPEYMELHNLYYKVVEAETVMLALLGDLAGIEVDEYQETCPNPCTCEAEIEVVA
tara:strand:+ start:18923 stop:19264 length:342 start_codon:yes stop_codon:yes gene_type:complete